MKKIVTTLAVILLAAATGCGRSEAEKRELCRRSARHTFDIVRRDAELRRMDMEKVEAMLAEQEIMGLSPGDHIMTLYRARLDARGIHGSHGLASCSNGQLVKVAGLLVVHQSPPTAKGFNFLTLEDEDGMINVIVRPKVYGRFQNIIRGAHLLLVAGMVQREGEVINLLADTVAPLFD